MWNFFKSNTKTKEFKPVVFQGINFIDASGSKWAFSPTKDITAYEVALLMPAFGTIGIQSCDRLSYFKEHNLMRHFNFIPSNDAQSQ